MATAPIPQPFLDAAAFAAVALAGRPTVRWAWGAIQRRFFPGRAARRQAMIALEALLSRQVGLPGEEPVLLAALQAALGVDRVGLFVREPGGERLSWLAGTRPVLRDALSLERVHSGTALVEGCAMGLLLKAHEEIVGYLVLGERAPGAVLKKAERRQLLQTCEHLALVLENLWLGRAVIDEALAASRAEADRILQERVNAVVSHQLKTPLLLGQSMLADARHSLSNRERVAKRLDKIAGALGRFERNVVQNLDRHRIDRERYELEVAPTPLLPLIERCLDEVRYALGKREATARREVAPELAVMAHAARLEIVFDNLFGNALKVIPEGGTLVLEAGRSGDRIWIRVSDDGPGIPPARLEGLFGVQPPNPEDPTSTGFGLAICRDYLTAMGGSIALESNGAAGATFRLELPAAP